MIEESLVTGRQEQEEAENHDSDKESEEEPVLPVFLKRQRAFQEINLRQFQLEDRLIVVNEMQPGINHHRVAHCQRERHPLDPVTGGQFFLPGRHPLARPAVFPEIAVRICEININIASLADPEEPVLHNTMLCELVGNGGLPPINPQPVG